MKDLPWGWKNINADFTLLFVCVARLTKSQGWIFKYLDEEQQKEAACWAGLHPVIHYQVRDSRDIPQSKDILPKRYGILHIWIQFNHTSFCEGLGGILCLGCLFIAKIVFSTIKIKVHNEIFLSNRFQRKIANSSLDKLFSLPQLFGLKLNIIILSSC